MTNSPRPIDLFGRARFRLSGPDRERYLNGQVSNRVSLATPSAAIEACVCNVKGKLDGVVFITRSDDGESLLIDGPGELRESLFARLDRYLIADDCELADVTDETGLIHLIGEAPALPDATWRASHRFGPAGHDLWLPAAGDARESALAALGAPLAGETDAAIEEIRIRHGVPRWGAELSPEVLPAEAGLDRRAIDFHKGCYLGQEVISRIKSVGRVNRELRPLALRSGEPVRAGDSLRAGNGGDERPVGTLTSATAAGDLALAFVRRDWTAPGTRLECRRGEAGTTVATLEVLPLG